MSSRASQALRVGGHAERMGANAFARIESSRRYLLDTRSAPERAMKSSRPLLVKLLDQAVGDVSQESPQRHSHKLVSLLLHHPISTGQHGEDRREGNGGMYAWAIVYHPDQISYIFGRVVEIEERAAVERALSAVGCRRLGEREEVAEEEGLAGELRDVDAEESRASTEDERAVGEPELGVSGAETELELRVEVGMSRVACRLEH